jgi:hypothetical protein
LFTGRVEVEDVAVENKGFEVSVKTEKGTTMTLSKYTLEISRPVEFEVIANSDGEAIKIVEGANVCRDAVDTQRVNEDMRNALNVTCRNDIRIKITSQISATDDELTHWREKYGYEHPAVMKFIGDWRFDTESPVVPLYVVRKLMALDEGDHVEHWLTVEERNTIPAGIIEALLSALESMSGFIYRIDNCNNSKALQKQLDRIEAKQCKTVKKSMKKGKKK